MRELWSVPSVKNWFQKIFDLLWSPQYKILVVFPGGKPQRRFGRSFEANLVRSQRMHGSSHWMLSGLIQKGYEVYFFALDHPISRIPDGAEWYFAAHPDEGKCFGYLLLPPDGRRFHRVTMVKQEVPRWKIWARLAMLW